MFGQRFISLASFFILSSKVFAQIPAAFTSGFDPTNIELVVNYGGKTDEIQDGEQLTPADATVAPTFALGDSSAISKSSKYIIVMIDPDSPEQSNDVSVQVLHYLGTDFAVTNVTNLGSMAAATMPYAGPDKSIGTGPHRYIFLLYDQPLTGFMNVGVPDPSNRTFSVASWKTANGLKPAVAGAYFVATPPGGASGAMLSGTAAGAMATTTPCTSTALGASATSVPAEMQTTASMNHPSATTVDLVASSAPPGAVTTHKVTVGGPNTLTYQPSWVEAAVGDVVEFDFLEKNHTVTQSTFNTPCVFNPAGVKSGFRPNPQNIPGTQIFTYTVADAAPKWFYCAQAGHCQAGMVFAINPGTKFPAYLALATGNATASVSSTSYATAPAATATGGMVTGSTYLTATGGLVTDSTYLTATGGLVTDSAYPTATTVGAVASAAPSAAATHKVTVGGPNTLTYQPSWVEAAVGDVVEFDFLEKNHTVTQSTFNTPCVFNPAGVKSGFRPNPQNIPGTQIFTYTVADAAPKWFYCAQAGHCQAGMVFAINPGTKFPAYLALATGNATSATGTGGLPIATGNVSAPGATGVPAFRGAASRSSASWVLAGVAGLVVFLL